MNQDETLLTKEMNDIEHEVFHMDQVAYVDAMDEYEARIAEYERMVEILKRKLKEKEEHVDFLNKNSDFMMEENYKISLFNGELELRHAKSELENVHLKRRLDEVNSNNEHLQEKVHNLEWQVQQEQQFVSELKCALEGFLFDQDLYEALQNEECDEEQVQWFE